MRQPLSFLLAMLSLGALAIADPTWPSAIDELEEIMYQVDGFRSRLFDNTVSPCASEADGPGRQAAGAWLRAAFHDMSTTANATGPRLGGLDASLQYELSRTENAAGPSFTDTFEFMNDYYTSRSSMSDLLALGVYYAVAACGGPLVPFRGGRVDATAEGPLGVPLPENSAYTFTNQFARMGFSQQEMIQAVACGHTIGGVHALESPLIVPPGTATNDVVNFDSTNGVFDTKVVTEYLAGNTTNPLVVGPSVKNQRNSDFKVFTSDGNVTVKALANAATFQNVCVRVLQKMIEVVPDGVVLTSPIQPYSVKPVAMQLTLNSGGSTMALTGYIRVRTTNMATGTVKNLTLTYKNRNGVSDCGNSNCQQTFQPQGATTGYNDTFLWFPINTNIPTATGISSFVVSLGLSGGTVLTYDNNGNTYPMQDAIFQQSPQSCLIGGNISVTAAVRNDRNSLPVSMYLSYQTTNSSRTSPVPLLTNVTVPMTKTVCVGSYTFYTAQFNGLGSLDYTARIDVISGSGASAPRDDFNSAAALGGTCYGFQNPPASACTTRQTAGPVAPTSAPSSSSATTSTSSRSTTTSATASSTTSTRISSTVPPASSTTSSTKTTTAGSTASSSTAPAPTLQHIQTIGGYTLVGCQTETTSWVGRRALDGAAFAYDGMTLESCMKNCTGYVYWGTEYGRECYCGNTLQPSSNATSRSECGMPCSGNAYEYCGNGDRLELYSTTLSQPTPTATLGPRPTVSSGPASYARMGCYTEGSGTRALQGAAYAGDGMTLEACARACQGFAYWGAEYGRECYCGDALAGGSRQVADAECAGMVCAGDAYEYCGAGDRLDLYRLASSSAASSS
ncbi:heme peroxidase [Xylariaceae sp. FL0804]|nr:heme peroxidase [Xylariaceae sp. FL0804]